MNDNIFEQEVYLKALNFASNAHKEQLTPKGLPYLTHLSAVVMEVIHGCLKLEIDTKKTNLAITVAFLHDTIEDTDITYDDIFDEFGLDVAEGVEALTKDKTIDTKKKQMIDSLNRILTQPYEVQMVKLADRVSNLQEPPSHWDNEKKRAYLEEAKLILSCLKNSNVFLGDRLKEKIEKYSEYIN